jgi:hypothetical protein
MSDREVEYAGRSDAETLHCDPASSRLALPNWVENLRIRFQTAGNTATRHGRRRLLRLYALSLSLVPAHEREWARTWNRAEEAIPQIVRKCLSGASYPLCPRSFVHVCLLAKRTTINHLLSMQFSGFEEHLSSVARKTHECPVSEVRVPPLLLQCGGIEESRVEVSHLVLIISLVTTNHDFRLQGLQ